MKTLREHAAEESGQISVLILGVTAVVLMLTAVILGATTINLEARKLLSTADGAASAAASHGEPGAGGTPLLESTQVRASAEQYLHDVGASAWHPHVGVERAWISDGGETVHVELSSTVELPVLRWVLPAEVSVRADSHARVTVNR